MRLTVRHSSAPEFKPGDRVHLHKKGTPGVIVEHTRRFRVERIVLVEADINFVNTNQSETTLEISGWVLDLNKDNGRYHPESYVKRFLILQ